MAKTTHGMTGTRFYNIWADMKNRTKNKSYHSSHRYVERGIIVCELWNKFENFQESMYESYKIHAERHTEKNTTIERIDNNGNYEPGNCRWATKREQGANTSKTKLIEFRGFTFSLNGLATLVGMDRKKLTYRLQKMGLSVEEAVKGGKLTNNKAANSVNDRGGARTFDHNGKTLTVRKLSELPECEVSLPTLKSRLYMYGWDVSRAMKR